jgi:hypothetical protein
MVQQFSEAEGEFPSDNFTSNEAEVGPLAGILRSRNRSGGVYVGVGPEQNFSYIAALRPGMAFIVDIRRQARVQHLIYKALFELSSTRADFISMLFSRPKPATLASTTSIEAIWNAFSRVSGDVALYSRNLTAIRENITRTHSFALTAEELGSVEYVLDSFFRIGPQIGSRGPVSGGGGRRGGGGGRGGRGTNFMTLTQATGQDGTVQTFLASEQTYRVVRDLHSRNLIVPLWGDFAGPKTIRAVGTYAKSRGATITAFYLSNVEQYLFQDNKWRQFYANALTLPADDNSVFIRPYAMRRLAAETSLCAIAPFLRAWNSGRIVSNNDALSCPRA